MPVDTAEAAASLAFFDERLLPEDDETDPGDEDRFLFFEARRSKYVGSRSAIADAMSTSIDLPPDAEALDEEYELM